MVQGCLKNNQKEISGKFQMSFKGVSRKFEGCSKKVLGCFKDV